MAGCLRRLLAQVPVGRVTTPGVLAAALGNPIAARWVGYYLAHHDHDPQCACHRVVRAGGVVPGCGAIWTPASQARQLRSEGVEVHAGTVDLARYGFQQFASERPLERLARLQQGIVARVSIRPRRRMPRLVGGVDISYSGQDRGVAAYGLVDRATGELAWSTTICRTVRFPYISSYLTFRELPLLLDLLEAVRAAGQLSSVVLVDGTASSTRGTPASPPTWASWPGSPPSG